MNKRVKVSLLEVARIFNVPVEKIGPAKPSKKP